MSEPEFIEGELNGGVILAFARTFFERKLNE